MPGAAPPCRNRRPPPSAAPARWRPAPSRWRPRRPWSPGSRPAPRAPARPPAPRAGTGRASRFPPGISCANRGAGPPGPEAYKQRRPAGVPGRGDRGDAGMKAAMLVDSAWVLGTRFLLRGANFVIFLLLARSLSVGEFGFYGYLMSTAVVLSVAFDLGLRQSVAFFTGHEPAARTAIVTHMLVLWLLLAAAAVLTTYGMLVGGGYAETYVALTLVAAAGTAPMLFLRTGQGAFLGGGQLGKLNQSELISRVVMLGGTAALWFLGRLDLAGAVWTLLVAHALAALYLLLQIRGDIAPATLLDLALARRMLRQGAVFASGIILMILMGRIGIWLV